MPVSVLHLVGSAVDEFHADLSRLYARGCLAATADPAAYDVHLAYVSPDGSWRFPTDLGPEAIAAAPQLSLAGAVERIADLGVEVMVPQMFCLPGMTSYRALFDLIGVPYVGNPPDVMALSADKPRAKAVVAAAGVRVPAGQVLRPGELPTLVPPVVVKPVDADNSAGVVLVLDPADYPDALAAAREHGRDVLVETYVELGREVRCGVLGLGDGELLCLPLEEYAVSTTEKPVRTAEDKLARGDDGELTLVAKEATKAWILDIDDPATQPVWAAARAAHRALGARHYSLFDFRIDPDGEPWFLEAGMYCSFSPQSVVAVMAAAGGIPLTDLFARALQQARA